MPYYDGDETREEREERHRISQKRIAADNQALTEASGHLIGRLLLIPFKCILKLTLWSSRHAWQYGWRLAQRLYFSQRTHSGRRFNVIDNFKMCMRHSFRWKGRASRKEFWHFVGTGTVMYMVVGALGLAMQSSMPQSSISALVQLAVIIALQPAGLAVTVRRLHDRGNSALWGVAAFTTWWLGWVVILVTVVTYEANTAFGVAPTMRPAAVAVYTLVATAATGLLITVLVMTLRKSDPKDNAYGPGS